jgi:polyphosphate glucokinase
VDVLGIDIGGSGIKAAPVDVTSGTLTAPRIKVPTPRPALPVAVADAVERLVAEFGWSGPAGIAFPGVVIGGVTHTAANLDPAWVGLDARTMFGQATGLTPSLINDADAAGVAEMKFGAGVGEMGTVLLLTFGTGIGSALFTDGVLVPNTEFGHIELHGRDAELRASERAREDHDLSWVKWASRVAEYLGRMEDLVWPDLFIIGGGISRRADKFVPMLTGLRTRIVPAALHNDAGIVGVAMTAAASLPGWRPGGPWRADRRVAGLAGGGGPTGGGDRPAVAGWRAVAGRPTVVTRPAAT